MADVTKGKAIGGYGADTREYAANTRESIFEHIRAYASIRSLRGNIKDYIKVHANIHKYADWIFADTRTYADIRTGNRFTVMHLRMNLVTSALSLRHCVCFRISMSCRTMPFVKI